MNKLLLIYKAGTAAPFMAIKCEDYEEYYWGFFIYRDGRKDIIHTEWDAIRMIEFEEDSEENFEFDKIFKSFQDTIKKFQGN